MPLPDSSYNNFFQEWFKVKEDKDQEELKRLYRKLYEIPQALPASLFDEKTEPNPDLINNLFLYAILLHPNDWDDQFFTSFSRALELATQHSYPPNLIEQLKILQKYYEYSEKWYSEIAGKPMFIPMKHFLIDQNQLEDVLNLLSPDEITDYIESLNSASFRYINRLDLGLLFVNFTQPQIKHFVKALGDKFLKELIRDGFSFYQQIKYFDEYKKTDLKIAFIDALGQNFIQDHY